MDFKEQIELFSKRVAEIKGNIHTEEATKTSIILPFFQILGYDVFNPYEFVPEYTADAGIKKGEKVDWLWVSGPIERKGTQKEGAGRTRPAQTWEDENV